MSETEPPHAVDQLSARPGTVIANDTEKRMRPFVILIAILALALALAACGGDDDATDVASLEGTEDASITETTEAPSDEEALIAFASCMREQGVDFPDPTVNADGYPSFDFEDPEAIDQDAMFEAGEACRDLIEGVVLGLADFDSAEFDDTFLKYASCMREQGVEGIPDNIDIAEILTEGSLPFDPEDPDFVTADEQCRDIFAEFASRFGG